jgi:protein-tyrosine phosphatase
VIPPPPFFSRLREAPERLLHGLHRRRALAALQTRPAPAAVLVVCHGNICRSPFAAARLAGWLAPVGVHVASAGFIRPNRACPPEAVMAAARRGVDLAGHRSHLLTADTASRPDLIVVMDPAQGRAIRDRFGRSARDILVLGDLDPAPLTARTIRDPVDKPVEVFEWSYARIERCVAELVRVLGLRPVGGYEAQADGGVRAQGDGRRPDRP